MKRLLTLFCLFVCLSAKAAMMNGWDWESHRWAKIQIPGNGGTISASSYMAGTRFMQNIKQWGVRQHIGRAGLYLGDNTNAMLVPIIRDWWSGSDTVDNLTAFVAADYSEATGLTGNTTSKNLTPNGPGGGINLSTQTDINNLHMAVYVRTASNEASYCMGCSYAANSTHGMPISYSGNSYVEMSGGNDPVADSNGVGFYLCTRTSSSFRGLYKNGTLIVSSSTCTGSLESVAPIVHAFNSAGVATAWTSRALSYYALGFGIPSNRQTAYRIAVRNVQVAKGRNVE